MVIKVIRHGESEANVKMVSAHNFPDSKIILTENGVKQAIEAGKVVGEEFLKNANLIRSPYYRTRETSIGIMVGAGFKNLNELHWNEDIRLREIDVGYVNADEQMEFREKIGWFYYRFNGGESPADVYVRVSGFIDEMYKAKSDKKDFVIVAHGMTNRVIAKKIMGFTVEEFEKMSNPKNCSIMNFYKEEEFKKYSNEDGTLDVDRLPVYARKNGFIMCAKLEEYIKPEYVFEQNCFERAFKIANEN